MDIIVTIPYNPTFFILETKKQNGIEITGNNKSKIPRVSKIVLAVKNDLIPTLNIYNTKKNEKNKLSNKRIIETPRRPTGFLMIMLCAISVCSINIYRESKFLG